MDLPKVPKVQTGIKYPPYEIEAKLGKVENTLPESYMQAIKKLLSEIEEYRECLVYKGYTLHGLSVESDLYARKETTIR
jgi:hypothetical protein